LVDQEGIDYPMSVYHSRELTTNHAYLEVFYELNVEIICEETEVIGDATINESRPDDNFGSIPVLYTGWLNSSELEKQALLQFEIEMTPPDGEGCSHTIGYWKTHAGFGPQANEVSQYLPISLGNFIVGDSGVAVAVLKMKTYGHNSNGITKLMAQLLGAKLSIADGASEGAIATEIAEADAFLTTFNWTDWDSMSQEDQQTANNLKDVFDQFNNGYIGPGHCDEFNKSHDYCNEVDGSHRSDCDNYSSGHNNDDDGCGEGKKKKKKKRRGGGGH
ncbi:MAG: hypothetical protein DWP97_01915, partial [Calditrichaeota bacterium]